MNFIIVEDELLIAEMLKEMLVDLGHSIVAIAKNYNEFISHINSYKNIDCCFLDINLKQEKSGLDIAQQLNDVYKIPFIFITSYYEKTIVDTAAALSPAGYIIKPFGEKDLYVAIQLFQQRKQTLKFDKKEITIKDGTKYIKLNVDDIIWIKAVQVYIEIKTSTKIYLVRQGLTSFLDELLSDNIIRVHRTFAININYVNAFTGDSVIVNGQKIPLSRTHKDAFFKKIK